VDERLDLLVASEAEEEVGGIAVKRILRLPNVRTIASKYPAVLVAHHQDSIFVVLHLVEERYQAAAILFQAEQLGPLAEAVVRRKAFYNIGLLGFAHYGTSLGFRGVARLSTSILHLVNSFKIII